MHVSKCFRGFLNTNCYAIVQDAGCVQNLKRKKHAEYCTNSLIANLN